MYYVSDMYYYVRDVSLYKTYARDMSLYKTCVRGVSLCKISETNLVLVM